MMIAGQLVINSECQNVTMALLEAMFENLKSDLSKSTNLCHVKLDSTMSLLENQQEVLVYSSLLIYNMQSENAKLKLKLCIVSRQLFDIKQYYSSNTIEICGIPVSINENITETMVASVRRWELILAWMLLMPVTGLR